ncbi:DUF6734 family protein [Dysgonomonas sp. ZJ709]|uniref:DUF6734 family protein n=1 Tax=Dysgonomonas sp. ZJ709 TaxID=2709797 RepID=UPI0013EBE3A7|nr:DUF6734 family protein [Dysgonomonas sp. ZJ709]
MKVVQTFWSGGKNPLKNIFGWAEPQYHLMSWALSCLSLREHYDEVIMYTDSTGHKLFSEFLKLPYTEIIIQYEDLVCQEAYWAYPKLLTYSLQKEPFIHVDGDVYLPKRLSPEIEIGDLIAQNKEIGTSYYRGMMDTLMASNVIIPDFLKKELQKKSISSYNAGVLGGNNIEFIQKYCHAAFDFINTNHLNDIDNKSTNVNQNILFEQVLFYALAAKENKAVTTVIDRSVNDSGYSYQDFCDFYSYDKYSLMHLIGGHKRNPKICELLARTLLKKYPEYYERIVKLFPLKNNRFSTSKSKNSPLKKSKRWGNLSNTELLNLEKQLCNYFEFLNSSDDIKFQTTIKRNPHLHLYEKKGNKYSGTKQIRIDIASIPTFAGKGIQEVFINDLCHNILTLLDTETYFESLLEGLKPCFGTTISKDKIKIYQSVLKNMEYLFINKLIYTSKIDN